MTLSNLSDEIRLLIKWGGVALVILFLFWLVWLVISGISNFILKPTGEDIAYGNLAPPVFTKTLHNVRSDAYIVETQLPRSEENPKALVYKTESIELVSDEELKGYSRSFGVAGETKTGSGNVISWKHRNGAKLDVNTRLRHITYRFDFAKEPEVLAGKVSAGEEQISNGVESTLENLNLLPDDIDKDKPSIQFFSIDGSEVKSSSKESANSIQASYFRKIAGKTTVGQAPIRLLLSQNGNRILELDYNYSPINPVGSPYPIIGPDRAVELLKDDQAFSEKQKKYNSVKVESITLSHWESRFLQPYLQPVWAFLLEGKTKDGTETFTAYLPAIAPSFLQALE